MVTRKLRPAELAGLIAESIQRRGLRPGDPFDSTRAVARSFGVSTKAANDALRLLAGRGILVRRQRSGTFVGPSGGIRSRASDLRTVHILEQSAAFELLKPLVLDLARGLRQTCPCEALQLATIPPDADARFAGDYIGAQRAAGALHGAVLLLSTPPVQRAFHDAGVPTVVVGSPHPEHRDIASVDLDWHRHGRAIIQSARRKRRRRIGVIMLNRWAYGDNLLLDGMRESFDDTQPAGSAFVLRSVDPNPEAVAAAVEELTAPPHGVNALVCRTATAAKWAIDAMAARARAVPDDVLLFAADHVEGELAGRCIGIEPEVTYAAMGQAVGRLLTEQLDAKQPQDLPAERTPST